MDAYGNLTEVSEFAGGRRIRLISYLDEDVAMGAIRRSDEAEINYRLGVRHVSTDDPADSLFAAIGGLAAWQDQFALAWAGGALPWTDGGPDPSYYISYLGGADSDGQVFTVCDPLDGQGNPVPYDPANPPAWRRSQFGGPAQQLAPPSLFRVSFVNGCWFNLYFPVLRPGDNYVFDCAHSDTSEGNPITWFEPNGGDNQIWRAATLGPGL